MKFSKKIKYRIAVICMVVVLLLNGILPTLINYSVYATDELSEGERLKDFASWISQNMQLHALNDDNSPEVVGTAYLDFDTVDKGNIYVSEAGDLVDGLTGKKYSLEIYATLDGYEKGQGYVSAVNPTGGIQYIPELGESQNKATTGITYILSRNENVDMDLSSSYVVVLREISVDGEPKEIAVEVTPNNTEDPEDKKNISTGGETTIIDVPEDDRVSDHAGLFEHAISIFIRGIAKGLLTLIRLLSGSDTLSIETIIFNRYSYTSLSLFENENRIANPLIDNGIKDTLNSVFKFFQSIAIILYMIIIAYMGLRIMLNSTARQGAKYKELILYLIQGVMILFLFPYVIKYTIDVNDAFVHYIDINKVSTKNVSASFSGVNSELNNITSVSEKTENDLLNGSDYMSIMYQEAKEKGRLVYAICFAVMVKQLLAFLIIYFKRLLTIIFLIAIFPLVSISYAIDKIGDGKSQAFNNWYKEFALNVFLQSFHAIIYVIGMAMIVEIGNGGNFSRNWLIIILLLEFIANGDEFLRNLFGVKGGGADTVKGIAKSVVQTKVALDVAAGAKKAVTNRFKAGGHLAKFNDARVSMMEGFSQARYAKAERKQSMAEKATIDTKIADLGLGDEEEKPIPLNTSVDIILGDQNATDEEKKEALNSLIDAVNGDASEEELKNMADYAVSQYGAEAAKQLDTLIKTQAAANAILAGGLTNIELNENIEVLLEAYKIGGMAAVIAGRVGSERKLQQIKLSQNTKFARPEENTSPKNNKKKNKLPKSRKKRRDRYEGRFTPTQDQRENPEVSNETSERPRDMLGNGGKISATAKRNNVSKNSSASKGNSRFMDNQSKPADNQPNYNVPSNLAVGGANAKAGKRQKLIKDQANMFEKIGRHEDAEELRAKLNGSSGARTKNPFKNRPGARSNIKNGRISGKVTINGRPATAAIKRERPGGVRANGHMDTQRVVITTQKSENGKIRVPVRSYNAPSKNFISVDVNDSDTKIIVCKKVKTKLAEVGDKKSETSVVAETLKERRKISGFTGDISNKLDTLKDNKIKLSEEVTKMVSRDAVRNIEMTGSTIINGRHIASGMPTTRPYVEVKPTEAMLELGKKYIKPELLNDNSKRSEKVISLASSVAALNMISSGKVELTASETLDHIDNIKQIKIGLDDDLAKLKAVNVDKLPSDKKEKYNAQLERTQNYVDEVNNVVGKLDYELSDVEANLRVKVLNDTSLIDNDDPNRNQIINSSIRYVQDKLSDDSVFLNELHYNRDELKVGVEPMQRYGREYKENGISIEYTPTELDLERMAVLDEKRAIEETMEEQRQKIIKSRGEYVKSAGNLAINAAKGLADSFGTVGSISLGAISAGVGSSGKNKDYMLASAESGLAGYTMAENMYSSVSHGASKFVRDSAKNIERATRNVPVVKKSKNSIQKAYASALKLGTEVPESSTMSSDAYRQRELEKLEKHSKVKGKSIEELSKKNSDGANN